MKKILLLAAVAAFILPSCAKIDNVNKAAEKGTPIGFGVYIPKATKAGAAGTITVNGAGSTTSLQDVGFGVFATYSDGGTYDQTIGPNFMYNTKVSGETWSYAPKKYWPNETIDDNNGASGPAAADYLSFFAYAPYVGDIFNGNTFTGSTDEGIVALTANNATTDPKVTYKVSQDPTKAVDLLWAVAPEGGFSYTDVHGATVSVAEGYPLINLTKPNTTTKVPFRFKHATSRLSLKIVGAYDQVSVGGTLDAATEVTVEEVQLTVPTYTQGKLNLHNTNKDTPYWEDLSGEFNTLTVSGEKLNISIRDGAPGANVGSDAEHMQNVFANDNYYFTLIPKAGDKEVTVKITYYVTTTDAALVGGKSRVQNVISKTITISDGFAAGKAYTIAIVIGLTSVKLQATVDDWDTGTITYADLPLNS